MEYGVGWGNLMPILTSNTGQKYLVDSEFDLRLEKWVGIEHLEYSRNDLIVRGNVADLLDFFEKEGVS
jgi:hypothetical protein